jgi:hypothetical protein
MPLQVEIRSGHSERNLGGENLNAVAGGAYQIAANRTTEQQV